MEKLDLVSNLQSDGDQNSWFVINPLRLPIPYDQLYGDMTTAGEQLTPYKAKKEVELKTQSSFTDKFSRKNKASI